MTEHTNDRENPSKNPSRPEGQDTSETMDNKTRQEPDSTEVLPAAQTPPTQQIAQATQRLPEGAEPDGAAHSDAVFDSSAPEGEVHPAYGVAAARMHEEESSTVQDAPTADDTDLLAPLRDPAPEATPEVPSRPEATDPASGTGPDQGQSPAPAQPSQPVQQARPAPETPAARRGPRVGTAVWGLIVIAVGLGILAVAAGVMFDVGVALIVLLGAAGVILVVGSVLSSFRRR